MGRFKFILTRLEASAPGSMRFDVTCAENLHQRLQTSLPIRAIQYVHHAGGSKLMQVTYVVPVGIAYEIYDRVKVMSDDYFDMLYMDNPWHDFPEQAIA